MLVKRMSNKWQLVLICAVLALAVFIAFEQVRYSEFLCFDDGQYVTKNPHVNGGITRDSIIWAFTAAHSCNWHPVTWLSHMLDCELFGVDSGWHPFNKFAVSHSKYSAFVLDF